MVADRLFEQSPVAGQPARGFSQLTPQGSDWQSNSIEPTGPPEPDEDSYEVTYKIRKWSVVDSAILPMLNVSGRVSKLEIEGRALLAGYQVLREGILCEVFSQRCSAAWQGARAQRLTISIMLPSRLPGELWLDYMLSQRNLWPTLTTKGDSVGPVSVRTLQRERRRLQAKHLWLETNIRWNVLGNRMYAHAPTGASPGQLLEQLFNRATRGSRTDPYSEKAYRGPRYNEVRANWDHSRGWMAWYKQYCVPMVLDISGIVREFRQKDKAAQLAIDAFMEHCAKRWQTKEGTYQIKRRRLLPDVRDTPEHGFEDTNMVDV